MEAPSARTRAPNGACRRPSNTPHASSLLSDDTVQPNAPGTQGYNRYAYVANNPTTWTDPSGHLAAPTAGALNLQSLAAVARIARLGALLGSLALTLPPFFGLALLPLIFKILIAVVVILTIVALLLWLIDDPWNYFPDGIIPANPPIVYDPARVWDAVQTFPNSPKDCWGGVLSEIAEEQAQGLLFEPP